MPSPTFHVFSGNFKTLKDAALYSEQQWEQPVPDDSWPEEDYEAYENRNPSWKFGEELGFSISPDFVETIHDDDNISYLKTQTKNSHDFEFLRQCIPNNHNTLVLLFDHEPYPGQTPDFKSTSTLSYHGEFAWQL
jgi:hypothetical protein